MMFVRQGQKVKKKKTAPFETDLLTCRILCLFCVRIFTYK